MRTRLPTLLLLIVMPMLLVGCKTAAPTNSRLVGKWRSIAIDDPDDIGPVAWEIEFRADGSYHQLEDDGFGIAVEYEGKYRTVNSNLHFQSRRRDDAFPYSYEFDGDSLVLRVPDFEGWRLELEKNDQPLKHLSSLPREPQSVEEAVDTLIRVLPTESLDEITAMAEDDIIRMHHGLGLYIRNGFGLWSGNHPLLESCGDRNMHPDNASGVILEALWSRLQEAKGDHPDD